MNEDIQALANSQQKLLALQKKIIKSVPKEMPLETFLFELRDYLDGLEIVTEYAAIEPVVEKDEETITNHLQIQRQLLKEILARIEAKPEFFGQSAGDVRRTIVGLQSMLELNGYLLKDSSTMQTIIENQVSTTENDREIPEKKTKKPWWKRWQS